MRQALQRYGRQPLKNNARQGRVTVGSAIPAPVGGWDAQSPLQAMPAINAVILDNFIPRAGYVELRKGFADHATAYVNPVETVLVWRGSQNGTDELFACSGGDIYDATLPATVLGSPVYSGLSSARFQSVNFANDAGVWLIACNGANTPIRYDGSSFAALTITGSSGPITLQSETLIDVMDHKGRLFWVEKDSLRVWYTAAQAIQGTANLLDLGPIFDEGGYIVAQGSWSLDGGQGPDDFAVWVTSQGQVAIFQGVNPNDATDWAQVGVFNLGIPLGSRCLLRYGSDLVILTTDGVVPLSQALNLDRAQENLVALTQKIQNAFAKATQRYQNNFGWQGILYPKGALAIYNVPVSELNRSEQYVQNVQTGAWCRFTNIDAFCWSIANDRIFFGAVDGVYEWDTAGNDNGEAIVGDLKTAFNYFGSIGALKKFEMLQPVYRISYEIAPAIEVLTDFKEKIPVAQPTFIRPTGARWDNALWDQGIWAPSTETRDGWTSVTGIGYCGAVRLRVEVDPVIFIDLGIDGDVDMAYDEGEEDIIAFAEYGRNSPVTLEIVAFNLKYQNQTGGQL